MTPQERLAEIERLDQFLRKMNRRRELRHKIVMGALGFWAVGHLIIALAR